MLIPPSVQGAKSIAPMINHQAQSHISAWRAEVARRRDQNYESPAANEPIRRTFVRAG